MDSIINKYYNNYNFPSLDRLYKILKDNDENVSRKDVQKFLNKQYEYEMLKVKQKKKKKFGHITAFSYQQFAQMDIFDLSKYSTRNKNYKYILAVIDVFSRKVFARPMKKKDTEDVLINLTSIFEENKYMPRMLTTDTDKAFMSNKFQQFLNRYGIIHDDVIAENDHIALGIIDRFALTLKVIFNKLFLKNNNSDWINNLDNVIDQYNNTPHSSLNRLKPNEAINEHYHYDIGSINISKAENTNLKSTFKIGDKVRIRINNIFKKGSEPRYTDKIYTVIDVIGKRITLDNEKTYLESDIIRTYTDNTEETVIEKLNKENSSNRKLRKEGLDTNYIIDGPRRKK
jgi:ribosomal protein L21E